MKIAIGGKGGSGKTTIAGILSRILSRKLGRMVAIDGDSNPNLALTLGIPPESLQSLPVLPRDLIEKFTEDGKDRMRLKVPTQSVVDQFGVDAPDNVRLLTLGRVDHAGAG